MTTLVKTSNLDTDIKITNLEIGSTLRANTVLGTTGQVLTANSTGGTYWATNAPAAIGANTQISFNDSGTPAGSSNLTFNKTTNRLSTANLTVSNTLTANVISANGTVGTSSQVLRSDGTKAYWGTVAAVTSVSTSSDLTGGPITSTGTIGLSNTPVVAGTYGTDIRIPIFTVDAKGRLTSATSTTISWNAFDWANTSAPGKPTTLAGYGITNGITTARTIFANSSYGSVTGGGTLATDRTLTLVNDAVTPGNSKYYGTDGTGVKGFFNLPSLTLAGSNTQIQFNDSGVLGANTNFTFNKATSTLSTANLVISGNVTIDTNTLLVNSVNNRVGIGTATPLATLDLSGNFSTNSTTLTGGTIDCSLGNYFKFTVTTSTTFSFTNVPTGKAFEVKLEITNGGLSSITWPASVIWPYGQVPVLNSAGTDVITLITQDGGTTWRGQIALNGINIRSVTKTATGTLVDFTGIPNAKKITISLANVSSNGTSPFIIRVGNQANPTFITSGYISSCGYSTSINTATNGFLIQYITAAASSFSGVVDIIKHDSNIWVSRSVIGRNDGYVSLGTGNISNVMSAFGLERVCLTTQNGTDIFDLGSVTVMWES